MRLTLHRPDVGVDDYGQWWRRDPADLRNWIKTDKPDWAEKREPSDAHPMADPFERKETEIPIVTVRRTVTRVVKDYEAEVLVRQGWEVVNE